MQKHERTPILFVTVGPPGSGKSSFCQRLVLLGNVRHLERDGVRSEFGSYSREKRTQVMLVLEGTVKGCLINGQDVVVDANHVLPDQRWEIFHWGKELWCHYGFNVCKKVLFFPTDVDTCVERRKTELDSGKLPIGFIRAQFDKLVEPKVTEGCHVYLIDSLKTSIPTVLNNRNPLPFKKEDLRCE